MRTSVIGAGQRLCRSRSSSEAAASAAAVATGQAFVFDIDGVLIRGGQVLEAGRRALQLLHDRTTGLPRWPVVFLTNGGGHTERWRAGQLSSQFGVVVDQDQVVLSHSPMRNLTNRLNDPDGLVACIGKRQCADVARDEYGVRNAVPIEDLGQVTPGSTPYATYPDNGALTVAHRAILGRPCSAVLVMHDSRDWGRDIQLCCDLLHHTPDLEFIFSNPDFIFPNEHALPRFGQGAFKTALQAVYREHTGRELAYTSYGKPHAVQYRHCEQVLAAQLTKFPHLSKIDRIYAIGDNPAADVRGANAAGPHWSSVLVRTGCFEGDDNDKTDPADYVVQDAAEFVLTKVSES